MLYIIKADLLEVLLGPALTYFPFSMVWIKANIKGKINPEMNLTDNFIASVDSLLIFLKFLLYHSKTHWSGTILIVRNKNVLPQLCDQSLLLKAEVV